ncbi:putative alpha-1,3-mannosyltransferase MNN15 [Candida viswanathii]|uniref:Putative alpha-1,3-mannosyltransferase MNN15 n=1 Tax=Candida viswanathii TaxID=5486 RepID=A0A367XQF2_9ASCO|nr:putative alpha-1,3-mannosyltransferase MNN15 [Candida viswanathii]
MRITLKRILLAIFFVTLLIVGYFSLELVDLQLIRDMLLDTEDFTLDSFRADSLRIKKEIHYSNYLFSGYANFTKQFSDHDTITKAPLEDKCRVVFSQWKEHNPGWKFRTWNSMAERYDKSSDKKEEFFKEKTKEIRKKFEKNFPRKEFVLDRLMNRTISRNFKASVQKSKEILQNMADTTTLIRLYGKCFLGKDNLNDQLSDLFNEFTNKVFPFVGRSSPRFRKAGETEEYGWPVYDNENNTVERKDDLTENPVDFIQKNLNGRGIVISVATRHSRDVARLIKVLRALNNKLPIHILYKNDISKKSMSAIEDAAIATPEELLHPSITQEHQTFMPDLKLLEQYKDYGSEFPKQDLTFVNIVSSVSKDYKWSFPGYSNKILAMLFTSFEEFILLDADVVPLVDPEEFFTSKQYQKSGTYFFKDRSLRDFNDYIETNFFTTLFPANEKSIETLFDIPRVTEKTLGNRYMTGWRHHQEAGVVAFNKKQHYLGLLLMFPLCLWTEPINSSVWGDKDLFWSALACAADENYEFNDFSAASVGERTTDERRKYYPNSKSNEICSTHPGHVNEDGKLLWINSGFSYCKKNGYYRDRVKFPYSVFEKSELAELFNSPLRIRAAVIPPELPKLREPGGSPDPTPELRIRESWKQRKKDVDEINEKLAEGEERHEFITEWGPQKGWVKNSICFGYYYCGYDQIESYSSDKEFDQGHFFEFDEQTTRIYDYLSKIWHTGGSKTKYTPPLPPSEPLEEVIKRPPL